MRNNGKDFEKNFKNSVPDNIFFYRFRDSGSTFYGGNKNLRFSTSNIADNMMFYNGCLFLNELKAHKGKAIPISCIMGNKTKEKQIQDLCEANKYDNVFANIIVFFIDLERCFVLDIENFLFFLEENERKSIPLEFFENLGIEIRVEKKTRNYKFKIMDWLGDY